MWTVVYISQDKAKIDRILSRLSDEKIITMLKESREDDFDTLSTYQILVPNTELEAAQDIIFDSEL